MIAYNLLSTYSDFRFHVPAYRRIHRTRPDSHRTHGPGRPVAIAAEGRNTIAMLRRGKEETFKQLLARLDLAIESATVDEVYIDEVNTAEG